MNPTQFARRLAVLLCCGVILGGVGCSRFKLRSQTPDEDEILESRTAYVGDRVTVTGLHTIMVEGVGLVTGLAGTGGDPPQSFYKNLLIDDMKKRGVSNPSKMLASTNTTLVLVRAVIPPVVKKGDRIDVEVLIPDGSPATSLAGGYLMPVFLAEQAVLPGRAPMKGHEVVRAKGGVLVDLPDVRKDGSTSGGSLKRGRILGGGIYTGGFRPEDRERRLMLYLRSDQKGFGNCKRVANRIGARFTTFENGQNKPLARAIDDQRIELRIHPRYKENYTRYIQVVRRLTLNESGVEERDRMQRLKRKLLTASTANAAATELEACGQVAVPFLKEGLKSSSPEVRFYSADALAYLGDSSGAAVLADAARNEPAFRVFAFAALATLNDARTHDQLRDLLDGEVETGTDPADATSSVVQASAMDSTAESTTDSSASMTALKVAPERRYGAFRALQQLNGKDPLIRGEPIGESEKNPEFMLHAIASKGEPLVHVCRFRTPEVVVFGSDQKLVPPVALHCGNSIVVNIPAGSDVATVSRFGLNDEDDESVQVPNRLVDVIRACGRLKAGYPDVVAMLTSASRQGNLAGRLEADALPAAGRIYFRSQADIASGSVSTESIERSATIGNATQAPNLFAGRNPEDPFKSVGKTKPAPASDAAKSARVYDDEDEDDEPEKKKGWTSWITRPGSWFQRKSSRSAGGETDDEDENEDQKARSKSGSKPSSADRGSKSATLSVSAAVSSNSSSAK